MVRIWNAAPVIASDLHLQSLFSPAIAFFLAVRIARRSESAWTDAHWGWMPSSEYDCFLQTGQSRIVGAT